MNAALAAAYAAYNMTLEPGESSLVGSVVKGWSYNLALTGTAAGAVVFVTSLVIADVALGVLGGSLFVVFGILSYSLDSLAVSATLNQIVDKLTQKIKTLHRLILNLKKTVSSLNAELKQSSENIKKYEAMPAKIEEMDKKLRASNAENQRVLSDWEKVTNENKEIAKGVQQLVSTFTVQVEKLPEEREALENLLTNVIGQVKTMGDGVFSLTQNNQMLKKHMEEFDCENQEFATNLQNMEKVLKGFSYHHHEQANQIEELKKQNRELDRNQDELEETTDKLHDKIDRLDRVTKTVDEKVKRGSDDADEILKLLEKENK